MDTKPDKKDEALYQVIWLIRRLFRALAQKSSENLSAFGISVADRAVMEFLYPEKKMSVPEIAEQYKVSRQHVQATVNSLHAQGLVETHDNPRHKRSSHIQLTEKGRKLFATVLRKDEQVIQQLFSHLSESDVQITHRTLKSILVKLDEE